MADQIGTVATVIRRMLVAVAQAHADRMWHVGCSDTTSSAALTQLLGFRLLRSARHVRFCSCPVGLNGFNRKSGKATRFCGVRTASRGNTTPLRAACWPEAWAWACTGCSRRTRVSLRKVSDMPMQALACTRDTPSMATPISRIAAQRMSVRRRSRAQLHQPPRGCLRLDGAARTASWPETVPELRFTFRKIFGADRFKCNAIQHRLGPGPACH